MYGCNIYTAYDENDKHDGHDHVRDSDFRDNRRFDCKRIRASRYIRSHRGLLFIGIHFSRAVLAYEECRRQLEESESEQGEPDLCRSEEKEERLNLNTSRVAATRPFVF